MPLPTSSDVHVDSALTNISIAYVQAAGHFVARRAFPNVPVSKQSDKYFTYDRGDSNRDEAAKRAPGTETAGSGFRIDSSPTYFCDIWGWHQDVPDQVVDNADAPLNPLDDAAEFVMQKLMIRQEVEFASTYMTGGVWDNDYDGVASSPSTNETIYWSDNTNGDPITDIRTAKSTVLASTGFEPNTLIIGQEVFDQLVDHSDIVDRVKYSGGVGNTNPAKVNEETLAALFGLSRVLISKAIKNTAKEGATAAHSFIIGKDALLCYAAPSPSLMTPSAGYTFSWRNYLNTGNDLGIATSRIVMPALRSTRIEGEIAMDMKAVSVALGFFWDGIVA